MKVNDLDQKIKALRALIAEQEAVRSQEEHKKAIRALHQELRQKRSSMRTISQQINAYFSGRKELIAKNRDLSAALRQLRAEFNEEMYKMENVRPVPDQEPNQEITEKGGGTNTDALGTSTSAAERKLSEIEKLKTSHHRIFAEISSSYLPAAECSNIDQLLAERSQIIADMASIQTRCVELNRQRTSSTLRVKLYGELLHILSGIYSIRSARSKRERVLTQSVGHRTKQEINSEIVDSKRMEQRENLEEKLQGINEELEVFTNLNAYGSPSVSVRGSVHLKDLNFDTISMVSDHSAFDQNQMNESKQTVHSLIQYLQDFLPLTIGRQVETLKMKAMSDDNEAEIEGMVKEITLELQQMRPGGEREAAKEGSHWYLNHNMATFDEFDALDIKIPMVLCDVPEAIHTMLHRIRSIQHMNKCFAIV